MRQNIRSFTVTLGMVWILAGGCSNDQAHSAPSADPGVSGGIALNSHLLVDQFGYLPGDPKVSVIRSPQVGYDKADRFSPGKAYQIRRVADGSVAFSGAPQAWKHGATEASSGDQGWWFDFSALKEPGRYFVYDVEKNVRSPAFEIGTEVYKPVLRAALRMFYYQRSGLPKLQPQAEACWTDAAAYLGPNQDSAAHDVTDRDNPEKIRDLSGGWFDAGDTNKYVTFAVQPVHQLLTAYEDNKAAFTDDFNIPESGNGVPDVLDEVKWETDWLKKMQYPDGSVALKVGEVVYAGASPPSSDHSARFYVPACTSATIASAGMLAHAAVVFRDFPALKSEADALGRRARLAWRNYQSTPAKQSRCDSGVVHAGNADLSVADQSALAVEAAVYLYALTGDQAYGDYVKAHYKETKPYHDMGWTRYQPDQGEALLYYTRLKEADLTLKNSILADKMADAAAGNQIYGFNADDDLYRAYLPDAQYHWGSNNPRANYGNTNLDVLNFGPPAKAGSSRTRAIEILHYFHGVNPFGMIYLSNMYEYGATRSVNEIFHVWFAHDSKWSDAKTSQCGPAPGFVPGGPNVNAVKDGVPAGISPPSGQPPQKSYKDWNIGPPDSSWAITEPAIYYQSAYIRLLSAFVQ